MFNCQDRMQQEEDRARELVRSGYTNSKSIEDFSDEELKAELKRRLKKEKDEKLMKEAAQFVKRFNDMSKEDQDTLRDTILKELDALENICKTNRLLE